MEVAMVLIPVDSTAVYAFGYDDEHHTLDVVFYRSGVYRYFDVPRDVYDNWLTAESKGRYLHQAVIGYFPYERLRPRRRQPAAESADTPESTVTETVEEAERVEESAEMPSTDEHGDTKADNTTMEENAVP